MKYILIILIALFSSCSYPKGTSDPASCLHKIDSIAESQSFREAIIPAEACVGQYEDDTKLHLRLAELYLLRYLVDQEDKGLEKANKQFDQALKIDTTFVSNSSAFGLERSDLSQLRKVWLSIQEDKFEEERERILIWALIENFDSEKTPKLIK